MSGSGRFVVIEGSNATGKSTLVARLAEDESTTCVECPVGPLYGLRHEVWGSLDPFPRLLFFVSGNAQLSALAERREPGHTLVGGRYIWSTIVYHSVNEGIDVASTMKLIEPLLPRLIMPEHVIFLTADRGEQRKRLAERGDVERAADPAGDESQERLAACYREAFRLLPAPISYVDTTHVPMDDMASSLRSFLKTGDVADLPGHGPEATQPPFPQKVELLFRDSNHVSPQYKFGSCRGLPPEVISVVRMISPDQQ